ncbi:MAG TPA: GntR family transcriptional regulator [Caulobacteraceae bacterium]|nr:GntR family transcriptional regulator [Caulobacteraceae bacterium]
MATPSASKRLIAKDPAAEETEAPAPMLHASIYETLRRRLITGKIVPGVGLSTRGLALEMGVSQMPVRDALSRLAAEGAVDIRSKRKIEVPPMTADRFTDLLDCRLLLEPEAAVRALPHITPARLKQLREIDAALDAAMENGDVIGYMERNFEFHFTLYRANARPTLNRLIEALWLQFGPFMRVVYGRYGTANLVDQHRVAMDAIADQDAEALRRAIASDIADGMGLIGRSTLGAG